MNFSTLLKLARTFGGAQLAVLASELGDDRHIAGARLRSTATQPGKDFAVLTFDVLYTVDRELVSSVCLLSVKPQGFELLM